MSANSEDIAALFKVGQRAHIEELLHKGRVFMNPVSYFAALEEDTRSDPDEGTAFSRVATGGKLSVQIDGEWQEVGTLNGAIRFKDDDLGRSNLYCLHCRMKSEYGDIFQLSDLRFGDSYLVLLDPTEFIRRLERAALAEGHKLQYGSVEYVDRNTHNGPIGVFRKFSEFSAQREFRIAIRPGTGSPLSFWLGDLSDIAMIRSTADRLKLSPR